MKKITRNKKVSWTLVSILIGLVIIAGIAGKGDSKNPRVSDLVNTKVRNWVVNATMDIARKDMVHPSIDDGDTFSYFAKPSFQIGIRGEPFATQVMDGHLWTGAAEWMVLAGEKPEPVNERIWTLHKGYLPCIKYDFEKDGLRYTVKAFQYYMAPESGYEKPVNFVRVIAENPSDQPGKMSFAAGFMYGIKDHRSQRMRQMKHNPLWRYEILGNAAVRDDKVIYAWREKPDALLGKPGKVYEKPFTGAGRDDPVLLAKYEDTLNPGESFSADFCVPHYPAEKSHMAALSYPDFDERLEAFEKFWEGWLSRATSFRVSERKVNDSGRAYLIHALMSQDVVSENEVEQHVNRLQYNRFWLRDSAFFTSMYEKWGLSDVGGKLCRHFFDYQRDNGNFLSQPGQLDGWGQAMFAFGAHVRMSGDADFAKEALPYVERAVEWLKSETKKDPWGLMPPTDAFDNETITGRYTGHNFWALMGLSGAADLAKTAGRPDLADEFMEFRAEYLEHFLKRLREVAEQRDGVIPPGLDVPGGTDWGNLLPVYPDIVMDPFDPLVTSTFEYIRAERMEEGIAMWHQSLHHYITERVAQTALVRGEQERAIGDYYAMLAHTGSCHEGFEWTIFPWAGRDYCMAIPGVFTCNFPPHGWYAADMNILFRNMLIREQGKDLHLCSAVSPRWARPGDRIEVKKAPAWLDSENGPVQIEVDYTLAFKEDSATLDLDLTNNGGNPADDSKIILHVPWFLEVDSAFVKGADIAAGFNAIELPMADARLEIGFTRKEVEMKSHQAQVEWYKREYRKRWEQKRR